MAALDDQAPVGTGSVLGGNSRDWEDMVGNLDAGDPHERRKLVVGVIVVYASDDPRPIRHPSLQPTTCVSPWSRASLHRVSDMAQSGGQVG